MPELRAQLLAAFEVEHRDHVEAVRRALTHPAEADLREIFRRVHSLKGAARAVDLAAIEDLAHRLEERLAEVMETGAGLSAQMVDLIHVGLDAIEAQAAAERQGQPPPDPTAAIQALAGRAAAPEAAPAAPASAPVPAEAGPPGEKAPEYVRVDAELGLRLSEAMHQLSADLLAEEALVEVVQRLQRDGRTLERLWGEVRMRGAGREGPHVQAFEAGLRSLTRELSALAQRHARASWAVGQSAAALRSQVDEVALTPAENLLGDLARMTRDIAREQGVEVEVRFEGLEVRAERRVLQALRDPIIHLLRNAISHGAEPADVRERAGKPSRLQVGLRARARGGRLEVRVFDDGPGPDLAKIEAAAVARHLMPPRRRGDPPRAADEILALAFEPGVSVTASVDRISGRGMGLSAVNQTLLALGGSVRLTHRDPVGAEVILSAPLSAARQTLVILRAGDALFALPSFGVRSLLRLSGADLEFVEGVPSARIQTDGSDIVTPVLPLRALLDDLPLAPPDPAASIPAALLVRGDRRLLVAVDAVEDVRELTVQSLQDSRAYPGLSAGAALLDDDQPVLVLSAEALVERWLRNARRLSASALGLAPPQASESRSARTILVADDSITTRTLEKSILEAQGYRVVLAVDGVDALNTLRSGGVVIDAVVADIEMPRMDGFSLLQAIKADAGLAELPVILMTSRDDPQDVRRGLDLGAEAYITKQKFDQRELLATISRVL